jgi:isocitrate dehydrogenase
MMLHHIGESETAIKIQNAWLKTLEEGKHTADIYSADLTKEKLGTKEFAEAVIANLGKEPSVLKVQNQSEVKPITVPVVRFKASKKKELLGVDIFADAEMSPDALAEKLKAGSVGSPLELVMITNRGVKVWPNGFEETFCTNHWRCRFMTTDESVIQGDQIIELMTLLNKGGIDIIKSENLYQFDGVKSFSLGQGQ